MRLASWVYALLLVAIASCGSPGTQTGQTSPPQAAPATPTAPAGGQASAAPASQSSPVAGKPSSAASASASPAAAVSPSPAGSASPVSAAAGDWLTHQHDPQRSGQAVGTFNAAATRLLWESDPLDGDVYAQVLVMSERLFVATQNDTLYSLDAASGHVVWSQHLGDPVPRRALPCGNVDPTGVLSTPVIDPAAGVLYAVAFVQPQPHHELVALDVASGSIRFRQPIDPPGANPLTHQQRSALTLANGNVYVPYGGLFGDCGDYHGWVVAASPSDGSQRAVYQVPTQREGAIWAPAGATLGAGSNLFVATGNGESTSDFDYGNAVVRLSPGLQAQDYFAPSDWAALSRRDADLGSTNPTLLDNGLLLQVGKAGIGYVLQSDRLGQIGGELFQAPLCSGAYGGTAYSGDTAFIACRDGLAAVRVDSQSFAVLWHGPRFNAGAPTVTDSAVWTIDGSSATLYALSRQDGSVMFRSSLSQSGSLPHFLSPSAADGRVYHSRGKTIVAFGTGKSNG